MGLGPGPLNVGNWSIANSKSSDGNKKKSEGTAEVYSGCWIKFRFIRSCISSRPQVDNPVSTSSSVYGTVTLPNFIIKCIFSIVSLQ